MASEDEKKVEVVSEEDKEAKKVEEEIEKKEQPEKVEEEKPVDLKEVEPKARTEEGAEPVPPPQPPRPLSPFQQSQLTLTEAFPSVESKVVRAVLIASGGELDPAFNGLLSLTDPDYKLDEAQVLRSNVNAFPPPPPVPKGALRHSRQQPQQHPSRYRAPPTSLQNSNAKTLAATASAIRNDSSQIEEDERLARLLAEEERGPRRVRYADTGMGTTYNSPDDHRRSGDRYRDYDDDDYNEPSFFNDDLPQLKESLTKGFNETKDKVNTWFGSLRKKMDLDEPNMFGGLLGNKSRDSDDDYDYNEGGQRYYNNGRRGYQSGPSRASQHRNADMRANNDFGGINFVNHDVDDDDESARPAVPPRPMPGGISDSRAPVDRSEQQTVSGDSAGDKKIALKSSGTTEEEDPFFIGDSEDEDEEDDVPLSEVTAKSKGEAAKAAADTAKPSETSETSKGLETLKTSDPVPEKAAVEPEDTK